jgi:hypothetical protein
MSPPSISITCHCRPTRQRARLASHTHARARARTEPTHRGTARPPAATRVPAGARAVGACAATADALKRCGATHVSTELRRTATGMVPMNATLRIVRMRSCASSRSTPHQRTRATRRIGARHAAAGRGGTAQSSRTPRHQNTRSVGASNQAYSGQSVNTRAHSTHVALSEPQYVGARHVAQLGWPMTAIDRTVSEHNKHRHQHRDRNTAHATGTWQQRAAHSDRAQRRRARTAPATRPSGAQTAESRVAPSAAHACRRTARASTASSHTRQHNTRDARTLRACILRCNARS